jgi:hypothetical protein
MDFRLKPADVSRLLEPFGYPEGSFDLVSAAGSGKDLLSNNNGESDFLLKQVGLSSKLHGIKEVVILYHDNCGAYGIADPAEEDAVQRADLKRIKSLLAVKFSDLKVRTFIIKGTASGDLNLVDIQ